MAKKRKKGKKTSAWIRKLKAYQKKHGTTYKQAMTALGGKKKNTGTKRGGKKAWATRRAKYGKSGQKRKNVGTRKGGKKTARKLGKAHYKRIGKKGALARWGRAKNPKKRGRRRKYTRRRNPLMMPKKPLDFVLTGVGIGAGVGAGIGIGYLYKKILGKYRDRKWYDFGKTGALALVPIAAYIAKKKIKSRKAKYVCSGVFIGGSIITIISLVQAIRRLWAEYKGGGLSGVGAVPEYPEIGSGQFLGANNTFYGIETPGDNAKAEALEAIGLGYVL